MLFLALLIVCYLIGAIPVGIIVARMRGIDITAKGSGNVGATNVARVVGKGAGIITLLGDILKGLVGIFLAKSIGLVPEAVLCAGLVTLAGHCFSIPRKLKGGKGVATGLGVFVAYAPLIALIGVLVFAAMFVIFRIVSLASITAALVIPFVLFLSALLGNNASLLEVLIAALLSAIIIYRHKENIRRLARGEEPRFATKEK
jgi:glycerol-3-phosphate acyltransferase PlsY